MIHLTIVRGDNTTLLEYPEPVLLSTVFAERGLLVEMPCGGKQRCLKCRVQAQGTLSPLTDREREHLTAQEIAAGWRYACMTTALGDAVIRLPERARDADRIVTGGREVEVTLQPWGKRFGAAVDIGTTTLAMYLYDLASGEQLSTAARRNPQAVYGADVISRLEKSLGGERQGLADCIRRALAEMLAECCAGRGMTTEQVDSLVITGNTAMLYLLCAQDPSSITAAPFAQDRFFGEFLDASAFGLPMAPGAQVYLTRSISAYVGGDITTALLSAGLYGGALAADRPPRLLVDIGTNGEMALAAGGRLLCCSTAAGPAFEGAGIYQGMNAHNGAVSRVALRGDTMVCEVIGGGAAKGICGSGILDAVAVLLDAGVVDETGLFNEEGHAFKAAMTEVDGLLAFRLPGTQVLVTQKDIRAVQLAKSAICAGMTTLLAEAEIPAEEVSELLIAGGFGSFVRVASAARIGLIPKALAGCARAIGNAAGAGAGAVLLSDPLRLASERLAAGAETVELAADPRFMEAYVDGMLFPERDSF